ncbi:hypothetical protein G6N05_03895 [Flavobacterium sp. F372]|jgi:hypothetical protein|uniref:DUF1449 family protein n=1 Tax=Flavobacterium bernardetii TaxID=2813823 RepID=A0ABR7IWV7_9FLAO|nr:hypothetical protein [Flavobacterium bernardetii]MBC5834017.1 hypothetical protein [Flavobacterium bernardetii]NHF69249.1 hypothetical protein [Flavobacterium bernardetii]
MKNLEKTSQLLPLAYLFLIVLGIFKETIYYSQVGINIMEYSSITDVILSPIAELTSNIAAFTFCVLYTLLVFYLITLLKKHSHKKWAYYFTNDKNFNSYSEEVKEEKYTSLLIALLASVYVGYFIGFGIFHGKKISEQLAKNTLQYEDVLTLSNGTTIKCHILGSNSQYYFYIKSNKTIEISTIGTISTIINKPEIKNKN